MRKDMTSKLLMAGLVAGIGAGSSHASSFHSQLLGITPTPATVSMQFNDDDQATVITDGAGPTVDAPVLDGLGDQTGTTVETEALESGDTINGLVDFPTFDVTGFGTGIAYDGYEATGTYSFEVGNIETGATNIAELTGTISIFEDDAEDADFGTGTGFDDAGTGVLLGSFDVTGTLISNFPLAVTADGLVPTGVVIPTTSVIVNGAHNGDGIFGDPTKFAGLGLGTFNYKLSGPASGYDFGSSGDFSVSANVVPSPSAAFAGLLGLAGLGMRRRRSSK